MVLERNLWRAEAAKSVASIGAITPYLSWANLTGEMGQT